MPPEQKVGGSNPLGRTNNQNKIIYLQAPRFDPSQNQGTVWVQLKKDFSFRAPIPALIGPLRDRKFARMLVVDQTRNCGMVVVLVVHVRRFGWRIALVAEGNRRNAPGNIRVSAQWSVSLRICLAATPRNCAQLRREDPVAVSEFLLALAAPTPVSRSRRGSNTLRSMPAGKCRPPALPPPWRFVYAKLPHTSNNSRYDCFDRVAPGRYCCQRAEAHLFRPPLP